MSADRQPTAAEQVGIDWWNNLAEPERRRWLELAERETGRRPASPADAYAAYAGCADLQSAGEARR